MALRECCDVYGTANKVKRYRIQIERQCIPEEGDEATDVWETRFDEKKTFCPRAYERLLKGIDRLTSPPLPRERASTTEAP